MSKAIDEYNAVLDFCRKTPQRKYNIQMELNIASGRLGTMLTRLVSRGLLTATPTISNAKVFEYLSLPNAEYTVLPVFGAGRHKADTANKGITVQGNVTTVSSGAYHTKGSSPKRSVWIGSSGDL